MADETPRTLRPATASLHAPRTLAPTGVAGERPNVAPLYQTAGWEVPDSRGTDEVAEGRGYFYARHGAPNADAVAAAVAALEGAEAGLCFSSGMAAMNAVFFALSGRGARVIAARGIYGATRVLLEQLAAQLGFELRFVDLPRPESVAPWLEGALAGATLVHVETISNPLLRVANLDGLGALCRAHGALLSVDATFATPVLSRALGRGAHVVMHSATKYLGGHGDVCAGVVVGAGDLIARLAPVQKLFGTQLDPFAAWLLQRGLRTLHLRVTRQVENARLLAAALEAHPRVHRVHYPGLASHPDHALAAAQLDGPGAIVSFEVHRGDAPDDASAARRVYDRLRLIRRVASLGDVESLVMHPIASSHRSIPADERLRAGITDSLLRLSVGIEDVEDLIADVNQALDASFT